MIGDLSRRHTIDEENPTANERQAFEIGDREGLPECRAEPFGEGLLFALFRRRHFDLAGCSGITAMVA